MFGQHCRIKVFSGISLIRFLNADYKGKNQITNNTKNKKTLYKSKPIKRLLSPPGGTWTRTRIAVNRILSPACLPIPPPGEENFSKKKPDLLSGIRAEDEARTRDLNLGKVALYQLSYFRIYTNFSCKKLVYFMLRSCPCLFWECKNRVSWITTKFFFTFYILVCKGYSLVPQPLVSFCTL
jgi:hypothetical protein